MYEVQDVVNWLLSKQPMSPKKLQKMLYYCYAWVLTICNDSSDQLNNKLFNARIEAWVHGPVIYSVYDEYRKYGFNDIPKVDSSEFAFSEDILDILNQVWNVYGKFNSNQLESLTHQEDPWKKAREGLSPLESSSNIISDKDIYNYYIQKAN